MLTFTHRQTMTNWLTGWGGGGGAGKGDLKKQLKDLFVVVRKMCMDCKMVC